MNLNLNMSTVKEFFGNIFGSSTSRVTAAKNARMMKIDFYLIWAVLSLMILGLIMVYSASIALPDSPKYASYRNEHFFIRQAIFIVIGLIAAVMAFRVKIDTWQKYAPLLFVITLFLLVLVLIPGIGKGVNGARRWLSFRIFNLQPSELMSFSSSCMPRIIPSENRISCTS